MSAKPYGIAKQIIVSILMMLAAIIAWSAFDGKSRWTLIAIYWSLVLMKMIL